MIIQQTISVEAKIGHPRLKGRLVDFRVEATPTKRGLTAQYFLSLHSESTEINLNDHLGRGITIRYLGDALCCNCQAPVIRQFPGGYCYDCFSTLARCDLCIVSPDRCHYHLGTCREPEWADGFCMQAHSVYLSNTSGPKVGITRAGREHGRWMDQGASSALKIATTPTRRGAGIVEARLKQYLADRTDWRKLVIGDRPPVDLRDLQRQLQRQIGELNTIDGKFLPQAEQQALAWVTDSEVVNIDYPKLSFSPAVRLALGREDPQISDNLQGALGPYLLLSRGVVRLPELRNLGVEIAFGPTLHDLDNDIDQMSLFS